MVNIALNESESGAARVAAARLATELDDGATVAGPPADQATLPELDAEIARLQAAVGKA